MLGLCFVSTLAVLSVLSYPGDTTVLLPGDQVIPPTASIPAPSAPGGLPENPATTASLYHVFWGALFFVPIGVFAYLALPRWAWALSMLVGPIVSVLLQLAMWAAVPGRSADPVQWLANTAGSALGVGIAALVTWCVARPTPRHHPAAPRHRHRARPT